MSDDRYTELMDQAQVQTERNNSAAVEAARAKAGPEYHPDFDGESCVECGGEIPAGRLALAKVRCVPCQEVLENASLRLRRKL